jgi:hypothetical protein
MILFVGISAVATGAIAFFNYKLVGVTEEMKHATAEAAKAAQAALEIDRPYGIIQTVELADGKPYRARITFRNFGRGPLDILEFITDRGLFDSVRKEQHCQYLTANIDKRKTGRIVSPDGSFDHEFPFALTDQQEQAVNDGEKTMGLYGRIRYRGGPPDIVYETYFFWWYLAIDHKSIFNNGIFVPGPTERNRRT